MSNHESIAGQGDELGEATAAAPRGRGRSRILVPAAIAAVAAAGIAVVPALAAGSDLPSITAQQLLAKALSAQVPTFSGTVQTTVDLGIPSALTSALPSAVASAGAGKATQSQSAEAEKQLVALLSGGTHTLQVAADGPDRQRISSTDPGSTFTLVHNGSSAWAYDGQSNSATHVSGITSTGVHSGDTTAQSAAPRDPQQVAAEALKALGPSTTVSVAGSSKVAGQSVYELSVKPKGSGSTIGEVRIAVDAKNGMPLQVRVNPADGSDSILNVTFATLSFGTPAASTFDYTPPSGATVTQQVAPAGGTAKGAPGTPEKGMKGGAAQGDHGPLNAKPGAGSQEKVIGSGWSTIYSFTPSATSGTGSGKGSLSGELSAAKSFGKQVPGGTLISTKLINVLVADNGTVYAGAVTPALLEQAAGK
ncbi:outer membrane lipoprotein-sorting protein [Streptacidiphilus sp. MAP12-16]|uniref:LolA family protein n=1 Tax=Streptacidiphilus sp. MAP12-16 TaxID=3156300 RepID=UPI0035177C60